MSGVRVRLVLQQCLAAQLNVSDCPAPADPADDLDCGSPDADGIVRVGRGLVVFVCFLAGADGAVVARAAAAALSARLSESTDAAARRTAVTSLPGDVLVVPQATLGGRPKGTSFQYHANVEKAAGARLYAEFVAAVRRGAAQTPGWTTAGCRVRCGSYGARQRLTVDASDGPFTHVLEL